MCGSATLAIVVSSTCMIVASMIETVIRPLFATAGGAPAAGGRGAHFAGPPAPRPRLAAEAERRQRGRDDLRQAAGLAGVDLDAWRSCRCAAAGRRWPASSFSRTGTRCATFTQLPVAFCAGSSENSAPVPAPIELDRRP